jgi:hypothetical protein
MEKRPCDDKTCRICLETVTSTQKGCVVAVPSKRLSRLAKSTIDKLQVHWDCSVASNAFHWDCWKRVEASCTNTRGVGRTESGLMNSVVEVVEKYDSVDDIREAAQSFADKLANATHIVCFTGAGISAAAGIPTYRGSEGIDTIDAYGGALKRQYPSEGDVEAAPKRSRTSSGSSTSHHEPPEEDEEFSYEKLCPTATHLGLTALHLAGKMHYCITQNCDDLHHKGGFPRDALTELHGNVFCEYCDTCEKEYFRDFSVDAWSTDW